MIKAFFAKIKNLFTFCLYFGNRKKVSDVAAEPKHSEQPPIGTDGLIKSNASFVRHNGRTVLVVMLDLGDVPSWVEYDSEIKQFSIVQNGGSVAYLSIFLQDEDQEAVKNDDRILLVTKVKDQQIVHHLQFVVR